MLAAVVSWLLHAQDHRSWRDTSCAALPLRPWKFGLLFYSWCWKGTLWHEPHLSSCRDHCNTSWSVWFAWVSLSLVRASLESFSPSLLPSSRALMVSPFQSLYWFTCSLTNFWAYHCVLFLILTLHFRGQALFYFLSHKCRLNFQNFSGQNNVNMWKLRFRLPPVLGCIVNWNEQSWQCLSTFLFWLQNKASCALYTGFSLKNTWNNLLAITLYFSSFFKDVCYIIYFGLEILSISTGFSGDCNVFWFLY